MPVMRSRSHVSTGLLLRSPRSTEKGNLRPAVLLVICAVTCFTVGCAVIGLQHTGQRAEAPVMQVSSKASLSTSGVLASPEALAILHDLQSHLPRIRPHDVAGVEKGTVQSGDASSSANHQADTQVGTFGRIESATGSHTCRSSRTLNVESKAYSVYSEWLAPDAGHSTDNRSTCQVADAMAGDLEQPGQLAALAAERAHGKEIIIIASNAAGAKLAFNTLLSLEAQGLSHYIWLTDDPTYCKALFYSPLRVACAWSSYLSGHPGWSKWKVDTCEMGAKHCHDAVGLWLGRIRYLAKLVDLGYNPLYLDTDFTVQGNMYSVLQAPPLAHHNLLFQREGGAMTSLNIGFIYCRNCAPGGRAQWVLNDTLDRIERLLELPNPQSFFAPMLEAGVLTEMPSLASLLGPKRMLLDQAIVNDSVETSVFKRHSRRRSVAAWLPHQQAQGIMAYYGWNETEYGSVGPGPPWSNDEAGLVWSTLSYPEQAHAETVAALPPWLVAGYAGCHQSDQYGGRMGHWEAEKTPLLSHFVGAPDKSQNMKYIAFWDYRADALAEWVSRAVELLRPSEDAWPFDNPFDVETQEKLHNEGEAVRADLPTLADVQLRFNSERLIAYKGPKVRHALVYPDFTKEYFELLARLVVVGAMTQRLSVVPPVDCASEWLQRDDQSRGGIEQIPWRWDWRPGEVQHNGAGLCNCTSVAPGTVDLQTTPPDSNVNDGSLTGLCCFPYLTGNAPFPACRGGGLGMYQHIDLQHIMAQSTYESSGDTPRVSVLDAEVEGLTGTLQAPQVARLRSILLERMQQSQVVYIEVSHWTLFPDVPWNLLDAGEQHLLNGHFESCRSMGPYIKGERSLPPAIPQKGPYD